MWFAEPAWGGVGVEDGAAGDGGAFPPVAEDEAVAGEDVDRVVEAEFGDGGLAGFEGVFFAEDEEACAGIGRAVVEADFVAVFDGFARAWLALDLAVGLGDEDIDGEAGFAERGEGDGRAAAHAVFVGFVGDGCVGEVEGGAGAWGDVIDGLSNTLMVYESAARTQSYVYDRITASPAWWDGHHRAWLGQFNASWFYPAQFVLDPSGGEPTVNWFVGNEIINTHNWTSPYAFHPGGIQIALGDASVRFLGENVDIEVINGITSINGREVVGDF